MRALPPRPLALALIAAVAVAAGLGLHDRGVTRWLEHAAVDGRFAVRGASDAPKDVVVVAIDDTSLARLPRFPFARTLHARVLDRLRAAGAELVVYDVAFNRPTTAEADLALFRAAGRARPVVFATTLIQLGGRTQVLGGDDNLREIGARAAAAQMPADDDGVLRHTVAEVGGLPSIAATVAQLRGERPPAALDGGWLDVRGPPGTIRAIPFADVLDGTFDAAAVRGRIVVVGATASVLHDQHRTALGRATSGPEIQATAIATALGDMPLRTPPPGWRLLLTIALALVVPLVALRWGALVTGLTGAAVLAAWLVAAQLAFAAGTVLAVVGPALALVVGTGGSLVVAGAVDARERRSLRRRFAANDGAAVRDVLDARGAVGPASVVAGYRMQELIGEGGMGVVYRARQEAMERDVAVKLIAPARAADPLFRSRFEQEARAAAAIEHPHVVPVYAAGEDDGLLYLVMRLVDGLDLARLVARTGPLAPQLAVELVAQVAGAIDAAHARGVIHRDVKPANVLVTVDEPPHAYLTDFGIAHTAGGAGLTGHGQRLGTLDYLAPEQLRGEPVGPPADVYALAAVLHFCLAGTPPFPRETEAQAVTAVLLAAPPSLPSELPRALDAVLARGLAKAPGARFPNAAALAQEARAAVGESGAPADPAPAGQRFDGPTLADEP